MDKFLDTYDLPKLIRKYKQYFKHIHSNYDTKGTTQSLFTNKSPEPGEFTVEFYQPLKVKELDQRFSKCFIKYKRKNAIKFVQGSQHYPSTKVE